MCFIVWILVFAEKLNFCSLIMHSLLKYVESGFQSNLQLSYHLSIVSFVFTNTTKLSL
jgi:hypothetical protein